MKRIATFVKHIDLRCARLACQECIVHTLELAKLALQIAILAQGQTNDATWTVARKVLDLMRASALNVKWTIALLAM